MPLTVFEFREAVTKQTSTLPEVIKASRESVEPYIPLRDFGELFGGYIRWRPPATPSDEMPGEAVGVWGRRNVSKFRRLLRERGAELRRVKGEGPKQSHRDITQIYDATKAGPPAI